VSQDIDIFRGIYADENAQWRAEYPRNLYPTSKNVAMISRGFLQSAEGIEHFADLPGVDRGGIFANGIMYRVAGNRLISVDSFGNVTDIGSIAAGALPALAPCRFAVDYDGLISVLNPEDNNLYYWDGATLSSVSDPDFGSIATDFVFLHAFYVAVEPTAIFVSDTNDITDWNPFRYGASEADVDNILGIGDLRGELYVFNQYSVEVFTFVGGAGFPFSAIPGAALTRGVVGRNAFAKFLEAWAFVGGGRNEDPAVWVGGGGETKKLSSREVDLVLSGYSQEDLESVVVESRVGLNRQLLYIHLPDKTMVYDGQASIESDRPVWFSLDSGSLATGPLQYRARHFTRAFDRWYAGDPGARTLGRMTDEVATHYDDQVGWSFSTGVGYTAGTKAIVHELELVALTGRVVAGADPTVWASYSHDGETWSVDRPARAGKIGDRERRLVWWKQGLVNHWRIQRFRGTSEARITIGRLAAKFEPLNV